MQTGSKATIRITAWQTVGHILDHLIANEVMATSEIYADLPEELADLIFSALAHHNQD